MTKLDSEKERLEFKENWFEQDELGQYISAMSNSAAIIGKKEAYFIWGVNDDSHEITGTNFNPDREIKNEPLKHYLARLLTPSLNFTFEEDYIGDKRVVLLTIPAAKTIPTAFDRLRYIRIGSSKERLDKYPEREGKSFETLTDEKIRLMENHTLIARKEIALTDTVRMSYLFYS